MAESDNFFQKAFYLGVGMASYAVEQANDKFKEFKQEAEKLTKTTDFPQQIQKLADEMVDKGKMSSEEARKLIAEMIKQTANDKKNQQNPQSTNKNSHQPRTIEIISDEEE